VREVGLEEVGAVPWAGHEALFAPLDAGAARQVLGGATLEQAGGGHAVLGVAGAFRLVAEEVVIPHVLGVGLGHGRGARVPGERLQLVLGPVAIDQFEHLLGHGGECVFGRLRRGLLRGGACGERHDKPGGTSDHRLSSGREPADLIIASLGWGINEPPQHFSRLKREAAVGATLSDAYLLAGAPSAIRAAAERSLRAFTRLRDAPRSSASANIFLASSALGLLS